MQNDFDCQTALANHPKLTALLASLMLLLGSVGTAAAANIGNSGP